MSLRTYATSLLLGLYMLSPLGCSKQQTQHTIPSPAVSSSPAPAFYWHGKIDNEEIDLTKREQDKHTSYRYTMIRVRKQNGQIDIYVDKNSDGTVEEHRTVINRKGHFNSITDETNKTFRNYLEAVQKSQSKR